MLSVGFVKNISRGFTLIEVLVVIAIISVLAGAIAINSADSNKQARDEKRQADLRALQSALEMYKNKHGRYPEQCASGGSSGGWSGQPGTDFACSDGTNSYILGFTGRMFAEFMPKLPLDPKLNGTNSGYVYRTNTTGTVYKLMAMNTVEADVLTYTHPLKSCDIIPGSNGIDYPGTGSEQVDQGGWCSQVHSTVYNGTAAPKIPSCIRSIHSDSDGRFDKSYGVWGGFEPLVTGGTVSARCQDPGLGLLCASEVRETAKVICK